MSWATCSSISWALAPGHDTTTMACLADTAGSSSLGICTNDRTPAMSIATMSDQKSTGRCMKNRVIFITAILLR